MSDNNAAVSMAYFVDDDGAGASGLRFASNRSTSSFAISSIAGPGDVGRFASLSILGNGPPTLAYRDGVAGVAKYGLCSFTSTGCSFPSMIDVPDPYSTDYGYDVALTHDAVGSPRIAFVEAGGIIRFLSSTTPAGSNGFTSLGSAFASGGVRTPFGLSAAYGGGRADFSFNLGTAGPVEFAQTN